MTKPDQRLGECRREEGRWVLRFERRLSHPPEKVFRALTESEHLATWMPCDIVGERRAGAAIELPFWPAHAQKYGLSEPPLHGQILVWDPPRVFEWTWDVDRLRFELVPEAGGTLLRFTTWLGGAAYPAHKVLAGYHLCLNLLGQLLDEGSAPPLVDAVPAPLEEVYLQVMEEARGP